MGLSSLFFSSEDFPLNISELSGVSVLLSSGPVASVVILLLFFLFFSTDTDVDIDAGAGVSVELN